LEYYDPTQCGSAANAFVSAWVNELHLDGYVAGLYGSSLDAGDWWTMTTYKPDDVWIARYDSRATVWALAHGLSSADAIGDTMWTNNQRAHQYAQSRTETWGGVTINIDIDVDDATVAGGQGAKTFSTWSFTTIDYPGSAGTEAFGVNDTAGDLMSGVSVDQIVGDTGSSGFLDTNGTFTSIVCLGGTTQAFDVNNLGQIGGAAYGIPNSNPIVAFVYINGSCVTFNYPGTLRTWGYGINDAGQIVGEYQDSTGHHGYLYNYGGDGSFVSFDYPGAATGTALLGINGQGQIVGSYGDLSFNRHSFLWNHASDGSLIPFDHSGASQTRANDINANGQVVGTYTDSRGGIHTFLYSHGSFSSFPNYPGACTNCTYGYGINNYGRVAGRGDTPSVGHGFWAVPSP
jgi:probable HAF family extracellular repeat protein